MEAISDANYCDRAESVIRKLKENDCLTTTSKIRGLLAMVNQIYNDVITRPDDNLEKGDISRIAYLKVRMVYEEGRDNDRGRPVKEFIQTSQLKEELGRVNGSRENFLRFCRYFEALVAYHRFYGGKDN
jgi:CRISPR-associated protein Csm2